MFSFVSRQILIFQNHPRPHK